MAPRFCRAPGWPSWLTLRARACLVGLGHSGLRREWRAEGEHAWPPSWPFLHRLAQPQRGGPLSCDLAFLPGMSHVGGEVMEVPAGARTCGTGIVGNPLIRGQESESHGKAGGGTPPPWRSPRDYGTPTCPALGRWHRQRASGCCGRLVTTGGGIFPRSLGSCLRAGWP